MIAQCARGRPVAGPSARRAACDEGWLGLADGGSRRAGARERGSRCRSRARAAKACRSARRRPCRRWRARFDRLCGALPPAMASATTLMPPSAARAGAAGRVPLADGEADEGTPNRPGRTAAVRARRDSVGRSRRSPPCPPR